MSYDERARLRLPFILLIAFDVFPVIVYWIHVTFCRVRKRTLLLLTVPLAREGVFESISMFRRNLSNL